MNTQDFKRKLTAVFSADVAGYSRLMGEDESATVKTLESYKQIMFSLIKQHRGRVVDSPGDNLLAEFASVVDAVQCGVAVQKELQARNAELPENRKMHFRIGINLGDVIEEGDRIYGDGVNIAARIEALADHGGICISKTAFDHIENKLPLEYQCLGEQRVKNIAKTITVYRVLASSEDAPRRIRARKSPSRIKWLWLSAASIMFSLLAVSTWLYWRYYYLPTPTNVDPENKASLSLPKGPALAVLPFLNISDDPQQDFFCDGIAENLTSALANVRGLFVIARNSSFSYKGKSLRAQQIGHELGVEYVIEGAVQKSGDRVRITAQLVETATGNQIWSEIYNRKLEDIFRLQDEITIHILKAIGIRISDGEQIRKMYEKLSDLQIFIKFLKLWKYWNSFNKECNALARKEALEIIELDEGISIAYSALGFIYLHDIYYGACESPLICFARATEAARKALSLDETSDKAHELTGYIFLMRKEHEKAIEAFKQSIILNPNCAGCYLSLGQALWSSGYPYEGIDYIRKAFLLNPKPPSNYYDQLGFAYYIAQKNESAIEAFNQALSVEPNDVFAHLGLAAVYARLGRAAEARTETMEVLKIDPAFSIERFVKIVPVKSAEELASFSAQLRIAGLE